MAADSRVPLGYEGVLYYLTTGSRATWAASPNANGIYVGSLPANLTRVGNVGNVKTGWERDTPDATTRDQGGSKVYAAGLIDTPLEFDLLVNRADAGQLAIVGGLLAGLSAIPQPSSGTLTFSQVASNTNTYSGSTTVAIAYLDGPALTGNMGVWGDWVVAKMDKTEELKDVVKYAVALKPGPSLIPVQMVQIT